MRDVGFDQSFSFLYSRRPGTPAASLPDEVPPEVKQERLARLQAQLDAQARAISERMVGTRAARARRAAARRRMRASSPGGPRTIAGSTSPVPPALIDQFADVVVTEARAAQRCAAGCCAAAA